MIKRRTKAIASSLRPPPTPPTVVRVGGPTPRELKVAFWNCLLPVSCRLLPVSLSNLLNSGEP